MGMLRDGKLIDSRLTVPCAECRSTTVCPFLDLQSRHRYCRWPMPSTPPWLTVLACHEQHCCACQAFPFVRSARRCRSSSKSSPISNVMPPTRKTPPAAPRVLRMACDATRPAAPRDSLRNGDALASAELVQLNFDPCRRIGSGLCGVHRGHHGDGVLFGGKFPRLSRVARIPTVRPHRLSPVAAEPVHSSAHPCEQLHRGVPRNACAQGGLQEECGGLTRVSWSLASHRLGHGSAADPCHCVIPATPAVPALV